MASNDGSSGASADGGGYATQIPFEFTVPSQDEEYQYRAARMAVSVGDQQQQHHHQQHQLQTLHHHQQQQQHRPSSSSSSSRPHDYHPPHAMASTNSGLHRVRKRSEYEGDEQDEQEVEREMSEADEDDEDDDEDDEEEGGDGGRGGDDEEYVPEQGHGRHRGSVSHRGGGGGKGGHYDLQVPGERRSSTSGRANPLPLPSTALNKASGSVGKAGKKAAVVLGPDGQPPPKKKRRRQALSCTECKRRKIRCDRVKPCAPCSRRGEGDKCHWNILEPVEKFVTRKEYDEIKDSLTRLQSILSNNPSATTTTSAVPGGIGTGVGGMGGAAGVVDPLQVAQALSVVQSKFGNVVPGLGTSTTSMNMPPPPPPSQPAHELKLRMNSAGGGGGVGATTHTPSSSSPSPSLSYPLPLPTSSSSNTSSTPLLRGGSGSGGAGIGGPTPFTLSVPSQSPQTSSSASMMYPSNAATVPFGGVNVSMIQRYPTNANDEEADDDADEFLRRPYPPRPSASGNGRDRPSSSASATHFVPPPPSSTTRRRQGSLMGVPEIHLGGLVVENQSPVHPGVYTAHGQYQPHGFHHHHHLHSQNGNKLDTLASVAHSSTTSTTSSAMTNLGVLEVPSSTSLPAASSASASSLTLAPIGGGSRVLFGGGSADVMASREVEMRRLLERSLPRKEVCDRLVSHYFDLVEWSLVLLHRPTFMYTYQAFWLLSEAERARLVLRAFTAPVVSTQSQQQQQPGGSATWGESFRASFVPPPTTTSTSNTPSANVNVPKVGGAGTGGGGYVVSSSWVALLFAVMCVALERMGFYDSKVIGINTVDEYQRQCRVLYDASQSVLVLGDIIRSRSLETVQTLVLHTHCQQSFSTHDWESQIGVSLSLAFRIGFILGLNKLTPEKIHSPGLLTRELGRRAWWNLVEADWRLSSRAGNAYVLHPQQNHCDLPANVEWEDLERTRTAAFVQRQRSVWTSTSSLLARIDLARVKRELVDKYNTADGVTYAQLVEHEGRLEEVVQRAPRQLFNIDGDFENMTPVGQWDRIYFTFLLNGDVIALHRPFLVTSLLEAKATMTTTTTGASPSPSPNVSASQQQQHVAGRYHRTLEISLRSAEAILDALEEAKATNYPGVSWWQTSILCHVAAVVLLIERWYTEEAKPGTLESEDADERKRKIVAAIGLLRDQGDSIELFATAANALESLLDATTSARRKARRNARRAMDLSDVVNPVNASSRSQTAGSTPPFVRDWIERPNTPVPPPFAATPSAAATPAGAGTASSLDSGALGAGDRVASSLSTLSVFPGAPLVADTSYDSQFWARMFDLEFVPPSDTRDVFFPPVQVAVPGGDGDEGEEGEEEGGWTPKMQGVVHTGKDGGINEGEVVGEGEENKDTSGLGANAIWSTITGPLGSLGVGKDEWHRVPPYDLGGGGGGTGGSTSVHSMGPFSRDS